MHLMCQWLAQIQQMRQRNHGFSCHDLRDVTGVLVQVKYLLLFGYGFLDSAYKANYLSLARF